MAPSYEETICVLIMCASIPSGLLARLVLSNLFLVMVLIASKEWLLDDHVSPLWLAVRVLGCGSMGALVWVVAGTGDGLTNDIEVSETGLHLEYDAHPMLKW